MEDSHSSALYPLFLKHLWSTRISVLIWPDHHKIISCSQPSSMDAVGWILVCPTCCTSVFYHLNHTWIREKKFVHHCPTESMLFFQVQNILQSISSRISGGKYRCCVLLHLILQTVYFYLLYIQSNWKYIEKLSVSPSVDSSAGSSKNNVADFCGSFDKQYVSEHTVMMYWPSVCVCARVWHDAECVYPCVQTGQSEVFGFLWLMEWISLRRWLNTTM